jgi:copper chaperone CopZ
LSHDQTAGLTEKRLKMRISKILCDVCGKDITKKIDTVEKTKVDRLTITYNDLACRECADAISDAVFGAMEKLKQEAKQ